MTINAELMIGNHLALREENLKSIEEFLDSIAPRFGGRVCTIPLPTLSAQDRLRRRLAFRNQVHLHIRQSNLSGERIFSCYAPDAPFPVYSNSEWWSDAWNAHTYARDFSFQRPFFEQFKELRDSVPHPAKSVLNLQNSDFCNNASGLKDCYLVFSATDLENCISVTESEFSNDSLDCSLLFSCQRCFDSSVCRNCSELQSSMHCEQCHNSYYLYNCRSCSNCLFCVNLRNAEYCIFNKSVGKAEYERYLATFNLASYQCREQMYATFREFLRGQAHPNQIVSNIEDCSGNFLYNSKYVLQSHTVVDGEDCVDCFLMAGKVRSCRDYTQFGQGAELLYECSISGLNAVRLLFCYECWAGVSNLIYCAFCPGSSDCFGCVGLHRGKYCIFNKQYSRHDYDILVPKIVDHMRSTKEWGEFFPIELAPIPYEETLAQRYFPLPTQVQSASHPLSGENSAIDWSLLPDCYPNTDSSLRVRSKLSGKPFSITSAEIRMYRSFSAPLPRTRYDERIDARALLLGPLTPTSVRCAKSGRVIDSYVPEDLEMAVWDKDEYDREFQ